MSGSFLCAEGAALLTLPSGWVCVSTGKVKCAAWVEGISKFLCGGVFLIFLKGRVCVSACFGFMVRLLGKKSGQSEVVSTPLGVAQSLK